MTEQQAEELREEYKGIKALLYNASQMNRSRKVFFLMGQLDRVVAEARKEGVTLR